jgi:hypothetical protein
MVGQRVLQECWGGAQRRDSQLGDGGAESFAGVLGQCAAPWLSILSNSNTLWHRARPAVTGIQVVLYVSILLALEDSTTILADTIICYNTDHEGMHAPGLFWVANR